MGRPYKLARIADDMDTSVEDMITSLMKLYKTPFKVAVHLGVYPNTIRHWLKKNGYVNCSGQWLPPEALTHIQEGNRSDG